MLTSFPHPKKASGDIGGAGRLRRLLRWPVGRAMTSLCCWNRSRAVPTVPEPPPLLPGVPAADLPGPPASPSYLALGWAIQEILVGFSFWPCVFIPKT